MRNHTKVYMEYFGYDESDFIPCEICGRPANDTHHIFNRGMGGSENHDAIENLMAVCREHHKEFGDITEFIPYLQKIHGLFMLNYG